MDAVFPIATANSASSSLLLPLKKLILVPIAAFNSSISLKTSSMPEFEGDITPEASFARKWLSSVDLISLPFLPLIIDDQVTQGCV